MRRLQMMMGMALLSAGAISCSNNGAYTSTATSPVAPTTVAPIGSGPSTVLVPSGAYAGSGPGFTPVTLNVSVGTTVTWGNNDVTQHTTTSDDGKWSSGVTPGQTFSFKFDSAGTYKYHCTIHPFMTGTVVVQ